MASATRTASAMLLSAAAMYWLDPTSGRRRRALLRDRLTSTMREARHTFDVGTRDLTHRVEGMAAEARHMFDNGPVDDAVLAERVRTCLGRAVSHPGAIDIETSEGRVSLKGDVLSHEYQALMQCVWAVRGVKDIEDRLGVHADAHGVSALQGGRPRSPRRLDILQGNWSPATRLLMMGVGGVLAIAGLRRGGPSGMLAAAAGGLSIARSTTNIPLRRLAGMSGRRAIDVRKTLHINAPVDRVFQVLSQFESYPLFMHNVSGVRLHTDGHSNWTAKGPAGVAITWDAQISALEPNRLIAWRTTRNSLIQHAGAMRFEPFNSGTRLDIRMSYNPPGGALGHLVASLFGADPKKQLDEAMLRAKTFTETGKPPRDAASHAPSKEAISQAAPTLSPLAAPPDAAAGATAEGESLH